MIEILFQSLEFIWIDKTEVKHQLIQIEQIFMEIFMESLLDKYYSSNIIRRTWGFRVRFVLNVSLNLLLNINSRELKIIDT